MWICDFIRLFGENCDSVKIFFLKIKKLKFDKLFVSF